MKDQRNKYEKPDSGAGEGEKNMDIGEKFSKRKEWRRCVMED